MLTVGVLARFQVQPDSADQVAAFFAEGLPIVATQPASTVWFAFRVADREYGAFAAFANDADREALLAAGGPALSKKYRDLFAGPPTFQKVDVLQARLVR